MIDSKSYTITLPNSAYRAATTTSDCGPLVSIILIFFNAGKFLEEAIQSVFAQLYNNWELLLVDDGSADCSSKIADRYAERFPKKVRYIEHAGHVNRGMSAARNLGIRYAQGQYIAFIDADDVWLPNKLQYQVAILNRYPQAAMVVGPIQWWYSWTGQAQDCARDYVAPFPPEVPSDCLVKPPKLLIALLRQATVSATSSLIRREIVDRIGGFEEDFHGMFEDQAFAAKVYLVAPVFVASDCHYKWRKHPESCCAVAVATSQYELARFDFLCWLERYLSRSQIKHVELDRVVEDEQRKCGQRKEGDGRAATQLSLSQIQMSTRAALRRVVPASVWQRLGQWRHRSDYVPVGRVRLGRMRRLTPISRVWGFDRGMPVDRYYIERFLAAHAADIKGRVLEIGDNTYTRRFGGSRVVASDILHPAADNHRATIVADLTRGENIPSECFDCIICTQTLMFIFEIDKAMRTLYRVLKPGGILLMTLAGVSHQISREDMDRWGDYWRFTSLSARRLCESVFPAGNVSVESHGNVLVAIAFLHGLAREELQPKELDTRDPDYEVLITVRAVKPAIIR